MGDLASEAVSDFREQDAMARAIEAGVDPVDALAEYDERPRASVPVDVCCCGGRPHPLGAGGCRR